MAQSNAPPPLPGSSGPPPLPGAAAPPMPAADVEGAEPDDGELAPAINSGPKQFPCGQCAAKLEYVPGSGSLKCPYCQFSNVIPESADQVQELDFREYLDKLAQTEPMQDQVTLKCNQCGAEVTKSAQVSALTCPFCGSAIVATQHTQHLIKPRALLPFALDQRQAAQAFQTWLVKLWFAPNQVKQFARADKGLQGIYVPFWTYDCNTTTPYVGQRGDHYWVNESYTAIENGKSTQKTRRVRKTRWRSARGVVFNRFDDLLVLASTSLPQAQAQKLEPWDLKNLAPYDDRYLSGMRCQSYQVDLPTGFTQAQAMMQDPIQANIRRDIGGDEQRISSFQVQYERVTFKHVLLPVWISAYRFRDRVYRFLVNARTGEVQGERPYSAAKITFAVLAALLLIAVLIFMFAR